MAQIRVHTVAVIASVIVNVLLIGFVIGQYIPPQWTHLRFREPPNMPMHRFPGGPPSQMGEELNVMAAFEALDGDQRKSVETSFRAHFPELKAAIDDIRAKRTSVFEVVRASPADIDRLKEALDNLRRASFAAQQKSQEILLDIAQALPEADRARLASEGNLRVDRFSFSWVAAISYLRQIS